MSHTMVEPALMSLPLPSRMISPCLPTAHSIRMPGPTSEAAPRSSGSSSCWRRASAWWVMRRPATVDGRISMARIHRSSVRPVGTSGFHQASWATAGMVYGVE